MKELKISPDFTREYYYERRKNMTFEEYQADVQSGANKILERIAQIKREKETIKA